MTREEQLACLTDRPCEVCKFHGENGCCKWNCVFEEEPTDAEPCEYVISRAAAIKIMNDMEQKDIERYGCSIPEGFDGKRAIEALQSLPSVTPKQKMGRWIYTKAVSTGEIIWSECSVCSEGERGCAKRMKFCPNCGAKMAESED